MALDDLLLSTGVDALIRLVAAEKKIELPAASKALGLPVQTVEDWARVLEKEEIIKIQYQLTKVYLVWIPKSQSYINARLGEADEKKFKMESRVRELLDKANKSGEEIDTLYAEYAKLYNSLESQGGGISSRLEELQAMKAQSDTVLTSQLGRLEELRGKLTTISSSLDSVMKKSKDAAKSPGTSRGLKEDIELLKNFESKLKSQVEEVEEAYAQIQEQMEQLQASLAKNSLPGEITKLRERLAATEIAKHELDSALFDIGTEQKRISNEMSSISSGLAALSKKTSASDRTAALSSLKKLQDKAMRESETIKEELRESLALVNKQMSKYSQLELDQEEIVQSLESVQSDFFELEDEINKTMEGINASIDSYRRDILPQIDLLQREGPKIIALSSKRPELKRVLGELEELKGMQEQIASSLEGLSRQAEIISLQKPEEYAKGSAVILDKVTLTEGEREEFEKKREELRGLIAKLWEEDEKSK
jgi:chromosome segregation ATPase